MVVGVRSGSKAVFRQYLHHVRFLPDGDAGDIVPGQIDRLEVGQVEGRRCPLWLTDGRPVMSASRPFSP